ncbi:MAG TPA: hypothetical protein VFY71_01150 [Planctomycetota bacterium]|nr:hypothetical protein [Planctomycetota bacterium]
MPRPSRLLAALLLAAACAGPRGTVVVLKTGQELHGEVRGEDAGVIDLVGMAGEDLPLARLNVRAVEGDGPYADPPILWRTVPATSGPFDAAGPGLPPPASYIRALRTEDGGTLDVAVGAFEREDGRRVYLVGAVHIAHPETFAEQQSILDSMDLVLWEGVGAKEKPSTEAMERFDVLFKTQVLLKNILNLDFQLDRIDYHRGFWRNSDMGLNDLQAELDRRNLEIMPNEDLIRALFGTLFKVIDPTKVPRNEEVGRTYRALVAPFMADTEKIFAQAGAEGLKDVLIDMRNRKVMDDLTVVLAQPDAPQRTAIYYGAGHLPGMARILVDEMGFSYLGAHWITAWRS